MSTQAVSLLLLSEAVALAVLYLACSVVPCLSRHATSVRHLPLALGLGDSSRSDKGFSGANDNDYGNLRETQPRHTLT